LGHATGTLFALVLLNASIIGAASVTLSTSYAFGDMFGIHHSLHRRLRDAKLFYLIFTLIVGCAAGIVLIPHAPLGLITTAVQALAGILLPSATVFLLLLCNDQAVLGPWVNRPWLNVLATVIVSVLLVLSLILMTTTVFPKVDVPALVTALAAVLAVVLVVAGVMYARSLRHQQPLSAEDRQRRKTWSMPPSTLLERPSWSPGRTATLYVMYGYLGLSVVMLLVKAVELGLHKG
jgi:hypothetical protein